MKIRLNLLVFWSLLVTTCLSYAYTSQSQVFAGLNYLWYPQGTKNQLFNFNDLEQDLLEQYTQSEDVGFTAGVKRYLLLEGRVIKKLGVGAVLRYEPQQLTGEVYRDLTPFWNDFTYSYKIKSFSEQLMAECVFTSIGIMSPYLGVSFGATQASLSYTETAQPWANQSKAYSGSSTAYMMDTGFAAGLQFELSKRLVLNMEYLYQRRGMGQVYVPGIVDSIPINLNEKSVNLQLGYLF